MKTNKKRNKEIRRKYELEKEKLENPDWCYCDQPDYDPDNDQPIGETEPIDGFPNWNSTNFTLPIYKCKKCGKKITLSAAY